MNLLSMDIYYFIYYLEIYINRLMYIINFIFGRICL